MTSDSSETERGLRRRIAQGKDWWSARRGRRSWGVRWFILASLGLIAALIVAAPSIFSRSLLVHTQLGRGAATHGWSVDAMSTRIGWFKPLRLSGVRIDGGSMSNELHIDLVTSNLTFFDLVFGSNDSPGEWVVTGVGLHLVHDADRRDSLNDFLSRLTANGSDGPLPSVRIQARDISISLTDASSGDQWQLEKSRAEVNLRPDQFDARFSGVLTEPGGKAGSFRGKLSGVTSSSPTAARRSKVVSNPSGDRTWQCEIESHALPLSIVALTQAPATDSKSTGTPRIAGEANGTVQLAGHRDGRIDAVLEGCEVRDFNLAGLIDSSHHWSNRIAMVDGQLAITGDRVIARDLRVFADFGSATIDGSFPHWSRWSNNIVDPSRLLEQVDGTIMAQIDVATLQKSLPGVLPIGDQTKILFGNVALSIESIPSDSARLRRLTLKTTDLRARLLHRVVTIKPIEINTIVSDANGLLNVDQFRFQSDFANATGSGDLQRGSAELKADMGQMSEALQLISNLSGVELAGSIDSNLSWHLAQGEMWTLTGTGKASDFRLTLDGSKAVHQHHVDGQIDLQGRWGNQCLDELSQATLKILGNELDLRAELTSPVRHPTRESLLPMRIEATGHLEELAGVVHSWTQREMHDPEGHFDLKLDGDFSAASGRLTSATLQLTQLQAVYEKRRFGLSKVNVDFEGQWDWPSGDLHAKSFTARSDGLVTGLRGRVGPEAIDCQIAWRANLDQVSNSFLDPGGDRSRPSSQDAKFRPAASRSRTTHDSTAWHLQGECSGRLDVRRIAEFIEIRGNVSGKKLALLERLPDEADSLVASPVSAARASAVPAGATTGAQPTATNHRSVIWTEPELKLEGLLRYNPSTQRTAVDAASLTGDWFSTKLSGRAIWNAADGDVTLTGPLSIKLPELGERLTRLAGTHIRVEGTHIAPLRIRAHRTDNGSTAVTIDGTLGWESGEVASVKFGPASLPLRLSETSLQFAPSVIPAGDGRINLAGEVQYRPGPITIRLQPGVVAESIRLTEKMTDQWLKFIAPAMMRVEKIHGTIGAELDEAIIVLGAPDQTHVAGRVLIQEAEMSLTPLMQELTDTLAKIRAMVHGTPESSGDRVVDNRITMPTQSVDFDLNLGLVDHQRVVIEVGETSIVLSGYVALDGRLAITAKIPASYFSSDADPRDLSDKFVFLPIFGTIHQPLVSPTGFGNVAMLIADRTAFDIADELLREQI